MCTYGSNESVWQCVLLWPVDCWCCCCSYLLNAPHCDETRTRATARTQTQTLSVWEKIIHAYQYTHTCPHTKKIIVYTIRRIYISPTQRTRPYTEPSEDQKIDHSTATAAAEPPIEWNDWCVGRVEILMHLMVKQVVYWVLCAFLIDMLTAEHTCWAEFIVTSRWCGCKWDCSSAPPAYVCESVAVCVECVCVSVIVSAKCVYAYVTVGCEGISTSLCSDRHHRSTVNAIQLYVLFNIRS